MRRRHRHLRNEVDDPFILSVNDWTSVAAFDLSCCSFKLLFRLAFMVHRSAPVGDAECMEYNEKVESSFVQELNKGRELLTFGYDENRIVAACNVV